LGLPRILLVSPKVLIFGDRFARVRKLLGSLVITSKLLYILGFNESSVVLVKVVNCIVEVHLFLDTFLIVCFHIG
jgi:hypothetical protein